MGRLRGVDEMKERRKRLRTGYRASDREKNKADAEKAQLAKIARAKAKAAKGKGKATDPLPERNLDLESPKLVVPLHLSLSLWLQLSKRSFYAVSQISARLTHAAFACILRYLSIRIVSYLTNHVVAAASYLECPLEPTLRMHRSPHMHIKILELHHHTPTGRTMPCML